MPYISKKKCCNVTTGSNEIWHLPHTFKSILFQDVCLKHDEIDSSQWFHQSESYGTRSGDGDDWQGNDKGDSIFDEEHEYNSNSDNLEPGVDQGHGMDQLNGGKEHHHGMAAHVADNSVDEEEDLSDLEDQLNYKELIVSA